MKTRRRKPKTGPKIIRVRVPTIRLVQIDDLHADLDAERIDGAIVKVCPVLRASEKADFDGPGFASMLRERGALRVILAPVIKPEAKTEKIAPDRIDPRELVTQWFEGMTSIHAEAARDRVLEGMEVEGL